MSLKTGMSGEYEHKLKSLELIIETENSDEDFKYYLNWLVNDSSSKDIWLVRWQEYMGYDDEAKPKACQCTN